eukprot:6461609-Amphidinium_carterae.2
MSKEKEIIRITTLDHTDHTTTRTGDRTQENTTKTKEKAKENQKEHMTTDTHNNKRREREQKEKAKTNIYCYLCGRPRHTSDKCWWRGRTYKTDQPTSIWSLPNDTMNNQQRQQMPPHLSSSSAATTLLQTTAPRLDQLQMYETG